MRQYAKITPEGTKDTLFEECRARESVRRALTKVFEDFGFAPVATPHLEYYDVFRRVSADWLAEQLYSATDSRGRLLVLRPDSTLPIARVAATRLRGAALPLRLYYHQSVFRRSRFYTGNSDELMQSGVELLGASGLRADLEILQCAAEALRACRAEPPSRSSQFRIELGHAGIFPCFADALGVDGELREALAAAIGTKNLPSLAALLEPFGGSGAAQALGELPRLFGGGEVLRRAGTLFKNAAARDALGYLEQLYVKLGALGLQDSIDIDLGLVHGQGYYTGLVFRGYIEGSGRGVLSGGRYDGLLAEFGRPAAAAGFGLALDSLAEALLESGALESPPSPELLLFGEAGYEDEALKFFSELRKTDAHVTCSVAETLEETLRFAKEHAIPRVIVIGVDGERDIVV